MRSACGGSANASAWGTQMYSDHAPMRVPQTRSPGVRRPSVPSPMASTTPLNSLPGTKGVGGLTW
jgi:hypothetical protein